MLKPTATVKLALAAAGLALIGIGVRFDSAAFRWTGIGLVAAAWLLRFVKEEHDS